MKLVDLRTELIRAAKANQGLSAEVSLALRRERIKQPIGHVNHFTVGGDPEFMLMIDSDGQLKQYNATSLGLETGSAFGADTSGRQVELRPYASKSVVEVVASTLATLRWFDVHVQKVLGRPYGALISTPFFNDDGLGGHVHFGRKKQALRPAEVATLDVLSAKLEELGVFDAENCEIRRRATHYGRTSDVRPQAHGYEYRTMPTWISTPAVAMFVLTLSKLAVFDTQLMASVCRGPDELLEGLLRYFRLRGDEDATLCLDWLNTQGWPRASATFGADWGLPCALTDKIVEVEYFPPSIRPSPTDVALITAYMKGAKIRGNAPLEPTWTPIKFPDGMKPLKGDNGVLIPELVKGFAVSAGSGVVVGSMGDPGLLIGKELATQLAKRYGADYAMRFERPLKTRLRVGGTGMVLYIGRDLRNDGLNKAKLRKLIKQTLPVTPVSELRVPKVSAQEFKGTVIAAV